ncbi:MAG: HD domain-containing phosphohydrolase [Opitutaceae bacterium]
MSATDSEAAKNETVRILIVDDDPIMLNTVSATLAPRFSVDSAPTGEEARARLRAGPPYALVIADMFLPDAHGAQLLAECGARTPTTVRIMMTGDRTTETAVDAINTGQVFRLLIKPFGIPELQEAVEAALRHHAVLAAEEELLRGTVSGSIAILLEVVSTVDPVSFELSQRLRETVRTFAQAMELPNAWELEMAAALARIGAATLPATLQHRIARDAELTAQEEGILAEVPEVGWRLLNAVPRFAGVAEAVRYQEKRYDGSGPPRDDRHGGAIPLGARILKIFTARARLELDGVAKAAAHQQLERRPGEYDPELLAASFRHFPEYIFSPLSAAGKTRLVPASELRPNQAAVSAFRTKDGLTIVAPGTKLTAMAVERVRKHVELHMLEGPFCIQDLEEG